MRRGRSRADEDFVIAVLRLRQVSYVHGGSRERTHFLDELCEPRDGLRELLVRLERLVHPQTGRSSRITDVARHEDLDLRRDVADGLRGVEISQFVAMEGGRAHLAEKLPNPAMSFAKNSLSVGYDSVCRKTKVSRSQEKWGREGRTVVDGDPATCGPFRTVATRKLADRVKKFAFRYAFVLRLTIRVS